MRPYLAIIFDSFRAAFASRVLWIVLATIVLFLLVLAPIGYQEVYTYEFGRRDVSSYDRLTGKLVQGLQSERATPAKNIAEALDEELQDRILKATEEDGDRPGGRELIDAFNTLTETDDWYDSDIWEGTLELSELRDLNAMDASDMEDRLRRRRARLRIEAGLPGVFRPQPTRSLQITYAWLETPAELPMRRERFAELLNQTVIPLILNFLLGVGAVFVGILVTSPIIPEMFQPGSLHLLLSKPISRPALYLSKFVGGCAFVLLCVALLVAGIFLIAGSRLDIWNPRLFLSIPVFVFLFAVYYSVSAFAGLHWRSAVVCVVVTVLFWFFCFVTGQIAGISDAFIRIPDQISSITPMDDGFLVTTDPGALKVVPSEGGEYREILDASAVRPRRVLGPVVLPDGRVLTAVMDLGGMGAIGGSLNLTFYDPKNDWAESEGVELPRGARHMQYSEDLGLLVLAADGLFLGDLSELSLTEEEQDTKAENSGGFFSGLQKLLGNNSGPFQKISPDSIGIFPPSGIALAADSNDIILCSAGSVYRLTPGEAEDQPWTEAASITLEGDNTGPTEVAVAGNTVIVTRKAEPILLLDRESLEIAHEMEFDESRTIVSLSVASDQQTVVLTTSDQRAEILALGESPNLIAGNLPYGAHVHAAGYDLEGQLWIAHHIDFFSQVDPANGEVQATIEPTRGMWRQIDAFAITPLRSILPQTSELGETVVALICGRTDLEIVAGGETQQQKLDVVRPLATCGGFIAFMLLLGSLYVYRQDF